MLWLLLSGFFRLDNWNSTDSLKRERIVLNVIRRCRYFLSLLLCLSLLSQHAMALSLASYAVSTAKAQQGEDIELICTGADMRWISLSQTELAGEFVFIDLDEHQEADTSVPCINKVQADTQSTTLHTLSALSVTIITAFNAHIERLAQRPYTAFPYAKALSRAPPALRQQ